MHRYHSLMVLLACVLLILGCGGQGSTSTCEGLADLVVKRSQDFESLAIVKLSGVSPIAEEKWDKSDNFILLCEGRAISPTGDGKTVGFFEREDRDGDRLIGYGSLYTMPKGWGDPNLQHVGTDFVVEK